MLISTLKPAPTGFFTQRVFMDIHQTLDALKALKPRHHYDIEIDNPTIEETELFFSQCEKRGFIPKWLDTNTIRVTNCAGLSKIQKEIVRLTPDEMNHIHDLLLAGGISAMLKGKHKAFCALFERERAKAKQAKSEKWERIYRSLAKADAAQIELTIRAIEARP